jgi:phosphoketolase
VGAYQLEEVLKASLRLAERRMPHSVVAMLEPGRFRAPRNTGEQTHAVAEALRRRLYPQAVPARLFVTHTRPEPLLGALLPLHTGARTVALGFINHGGTLNTPGMLFVNRCTWAHIIAAAAPLVDVGREKLLHDNELAALDGRCAPHGIVI